MMGSLCCCVINVVASPILHAMGWMKLKPRNLISYVKHVFLPWLLEIGLSIIKMISANYNNRWSISPVPLTCNSSPFVIICPI